MKYTASVFKNMTAGVFAAAAVLAAGQPSFAEDTIRVAKVVPHPWTFIGVEVGQSQGIWKKNGLKLKTIGLRGSAKLHQALAADSIDIGIGSGPGMGFIAKGAPELGILAMAKEPLNMAIVVLKNSKLYKPGMTIKDLKGKKIGVSTPSSLTFFMATRLSVEQGWGTKGITIVPLGGLPVQVAGAKAGNTDGFVMSIDVGLKFDEKKTGRVFLKFGDYIKDFHTHVIFATNKIMKSNPDAVRRFAKGWLESTKFMKANKEATVQVGMKVSKLSHAVSSAAYDRIMPMMSTTGRFDQKSLAVVAEGLVTTKILTKKPDMSKLYTEEFLPK